MDVSHTGDSMSSSPRHLAALLRVAMATGKGQGRDSDGDDGWHSQAHSSVNVQCARGQSGMRKSVMDIGRVLFLLLQIV